MPLATYRVQLNKDFDFYKLKAIVPYLSKLGISHIYASPIFQARKGSTHGYDIIDSNKINEELGGEAGFNEVLQEAAAYGLGWLQDIVPNHVAYSLENNLVYDIMEKGAASHFHDYLDIDWNHPSSELTGRILAPFLGKSLTECLDQKEISLIFREGYKIRYAGLEFPVASESLETVLSDISVEGNLHRINNDPSLLGDLLSKQKFTLSYWKVALEEINYRRFFDIIDLIGLRMESSGAFEKTHRLIFDLLTSRKIDSLRVDHIDGLFEPQEYLQKLSSHAPDAYLIVEKILTGDEGLPDWPIQGNTGYDFVNFINSLFIKQSSEPFIDQLYREFTGNQEPFSELLFQCKKIVIEDYFMGDIKNISRQLIQALKLSNKKEFKPSNFEVALTLLFACFPVYRTYLNKKVDEKESLKLAISRAKDKASNLSKELEAVYSLLESSTVNSEALEVLMRIQQYTGAIMAKGLEDTAFYRYNRFLALNEVGSDPTKFGTSLTKWHESNSIKQNYWPFSLNATSTHDTKRGEDARARLDVLSENPQEFAQHVYVWADLNSKEKIQVQGKMAPDSNEEFLIYQTLLGAYPFEEHEMEEFKKRLVGYIIKALREAKSNTSWLNPKVEYENAVTAFCKKILDNPGFLEDFLPFQKKIAHYGFYNTLSQTLLKVTCPGVPDFYQGSELWNLSMVDPDNRRPINYQERQQLLNSLLSFEPSKASDLLINWQTGSPKLYVIFKALALRNHLKKIFEDGSYLHLAVSGENAENIVAFARVGNRQAIVVVPRFVTEILDQSFNWEKISWKNASIKLPDSMVESYVNIFTNEKIAPKSDTLSINEILGKFPVALLVGDETFIKPE